MSESGTTSPVQQRDIRSAAKPFKRDRDSGEKWSMGRRPLASVRIKYSGVLGHEDELLVGSNQSQKDNIRLVKTWSGPVYKSHANKTPKPTTGYHTYDCGINSHVASNRMARKVDAIVEANDHTTSPLSKSLLELFPQHSNNVNTGIQTAIRGQDSSILYSYDNASVSPGVKGRAVGLDSLVEMAEKKWVAEQTDKIVEDEYEVLDVEGETTVLSSKKGKKTSPKQRVIKNVPAVIKKNAEEEDDGFELI